MVVPLQPPTALATVTRRSSGPAEPHPALHLPLQTTFHSSAMARRTKAASLPHILQWNVRSLRARHVELACLIEDGRLPFDVLALQETNVEPSSLRLPGYLGYAGDTRCTSPGCHSSPCLDPGHQQQGPRSAVYVRAGLPHVVMDLSDAVSGPLEACAVTVRMGATDTTVVSIYIPPGVNWATPLLTPVLSRIGPRALVCGDFNAHSREWDCRTTSRAGRILMEATLRAGLGLLKPPSPTFVTLRHSSTLDLAFTTPGIRYEYRKPADTWGSDHFPLFLTPTSRRPQEDRTYAVISWPEFRVRSKEIPPGQSFLDHVATCAREATTLVRVPASSPVPDLRLLNIRANRRRQERIALNTSLPADWTAYRRIDAACRRHARRRHRQSWTRVCSSIQRSSHSGKAWRLLKALVHPEIPRRPILAIAIARAISIEDLAELMADQFNPPGGSVSSPPPALPTPRTPAAPPGVLAHVVAQCYAAITAHELQAVLDRPRKRTAPGADGISHQMLRNLDTPERTRLLEAFNAIWGSATLPEDWPTAVVVPVLKPRKSSRLPSSYKPVSLTSAACKTMEAIALFRLTWIARVTNFLPEQLTGFRRGRCTADSIVDLVSTLEDARHDGDAVMLVLLNVKAAFDTLPHSVIPEPPGSHWPSAGIYPSLPPGPHLPDSSRRTTKLPTARRSRNDVALWVRGTPRRIRSMRTSLQRALDAAQAYLSSIGLTVSPAKTEALLYHPRGRRAHITTLRLGADGLTWRDQVKYLGLLIDRRLTWLPAVRALLPRLRRIGQAVQRLQARDKGCSPSWALRLYHAAATSLVTYALPLVTLPLARLRTLELGHRSVLRQCLGLPRISPIAATHAEAGSWPLSLLLLQTALRHAPFPPPPTRPPLPISVDIRSCSRRRIPVAALQQTAATLLQESLGGHLQVYTDGSVLPATGQAAAACVAPALGAALSCRLRFPANSTAAELAGLQLAADLLLLLPGQQPAVILTDSRAALQLLRQHQPRQHTVANLTARLMAIQDAGRPVSLQWLPSHVGITGNEAADQLAGAAHTNGSPVYSKVTQLDFARPALRQAVRALHPDPRVASGVRFMRVPDCLPRRERTLLLRLRTGCSWTQARLHGHDRAPSSACSFCGADETLDHLLCACPNLEAARRDMTAGYRNLGLPSYSDQDLLHPERSQTEAFRLLLEFLQSTGLATRL
ncbi:uncharacterized protein LOC144127718 [Amblyomma americanum]